MKIGISTGGGDCPGLNAVIRGVVRSAVLQYGWEVLGIQNGLDGLIHGMEPVRLDLDAVKGILSRGGTIIGTTNRGNPFSYRAPGETQPRDVSSVIIDNYRRLGLDALIMVGGDGSLTIARQLLEKGLKIVGCPKTIDNDLSCTDKTFGSDSATAVIQEALDRLHTTAESHSRVIVVEVMGRYAGWLALESGIAGSADVILIPEIPYRLEAVCEAISARQRRGINFSVVVVAEGAKEVGGAHVVKVAAGASAERLGGIGERVAAQIEERLGAETRTVVLGHTQRGGSPTHTDRLLGTRFGVAAVDLIRRGLFGYMVALHGTKVVPVPIEKAVAALNLVDPAGELVSCAEAIGISFGR